MKKYINKFYLWGLILLLIISISFYIHYQNNNSLLQDNVKHMTEMSVNVLNERINNWLNTKGQLINDAKNYIEISQHSDKEILRYLKVLLGQLLQPNQKQD